MRGGKNTPPSPPPPAPARTPPISSRRVRTAPSHPVARTLDWRISPADAIAAWPADEPLCALVSGGPEQGGANARQSRWSILTTTPAPEPRASIFPALDPSGAPLPEGFPFLAGRIGFIPYEAGHAFEPGVFTPMSDGAHWRRAEASLVHDRVQNQWWLVGADKSECDELEARTRSLTVAASSSPARGRAFRAGLLASDTGEAAYTSRVAQIIDHIRAGDVYQVNLAHHLLASFSGCPRALFLALLEESAPPFGALIESWQGPRRSAVLSISPELFLDADLSPAGPRRVVTRPIKGTRLGAARARQDLLASPKDAAELAMIVDLMRNDLGRVCEFGSVVVEDARALERHAGGSLLHTVATVAGRMRPGVSLDDLLRATFPPGSVTGAPKIAAMKLIRDLEQRTRGAYCGAIGFASDHGLTRLSVAIRTATIAGLASNPLRACEIEGELDFPAGAGIVADSNPREEWNETLAKADALRRTLESGATPRSPAVTIPPRRSAASA